MSLEVTSVKVYPIEDQNPQLLAFGSMVFDDEFVVHNMRLIETDSKIIVAMPNEEHNNRYRDIAHPITNECRHKIEEAFIEAYNGHSEVDQELTKAEAVS